MSAPRIHDVTEAFALCAQLSADDMKLVENSGYSTVINNRPDGETADQPASSALASAAKAEGLDYHYIPVSGSDYTDEAVRAFRYALETAKGPVLAFCRTGNRSANLWARAEHREVPLNSYQIERLLADAGYNLSAWAKAQRTLKPEN